MDYKSKMVNIDDTEIKLQLWDTAGQERFGNVTTSFYRNADIALVCYDLSDRETFENLDGWISGIDRFSDRPMYKILVGNKCDKEHKVTLEEVKALAAPHGLTVHEVSAKDAIGIDEVFMEAARGALKIHKTQGLQDTPRKGTIKLDKGNHSNKKCAC